MTETTLDTRVQRARQLVYDKGLDLLLEKHQQAIERYMEARRTHMEARRLYQGTVDRCAEAELDALLEMEQAPDYVPGKNAEQRKQQAEVYLAKHRGVMAIRQGVKGGRRVVDEADLDVDHARARVDHLELQIGARRSELDLIASFARGAS
jgi:hypothetical protein